LSTFYNGVNFRSRLEARWTFWFDVLAIPYQYEPQTFQVEPNLSYLPDFWLPSQEIWVEIKPDDPTEEEERKAVGLHRLTGQNVFIFAGFPDVMLFADDSDLGHKPEICNFGIFIIDASTPNRCSAHPTVTLNEMMLYVLGWLTQSSDEYTLRLYTQRLVDAVKQSNDFFTPARLNRDLTQKYWGDIPLE
jgi:hypothetical protein